MLENQGLFVPAYSTINSILHRNGLITKEGSAAATAYIRFEKSLSNEMWQGDFKGHFSMKDGNRCHPLSILDDHSRFCLCVDAKANERGEETQESFQRVFERHGLPDIPVRQRQSVGYGTECWLQQV